MFIDTSLQIRDIMSATMLYLPGICSMLKSYSCIDNFHLRTFDDPVVFMKVKLRCSVCNVKKRSRIRCSNSLKAYTIAYASFSGVDQRNCSSVSALLKNIIGISFPLCI